MTARAKTTGVVGLLLIVATMMASALSGAPAGAGTTTDARAGAILRDASGEGVGSATFVERDGYIAVAVKARGLTPGFHGLHLHANDVAANGDGCIADSHSASSTWFVSADGHYNPAGADHGAHAGDLPSLLVRTDGTALLKFYTDAVSLPEIIGRVVIVHAGRDNYANIPARYHSHTGDLSIFGPDAGTNKTGDAGDRFACGAIAAGK